MCWKSLRFYRLVPAPPRRAETLSEGPKNRERWHSRNYFPESGVKARGINNNHVVAENLGVRRAGLADCAEIKQRDRALSIYGPEHRDFAQVSNPGRSFSHRNRLQKGR